MAGNFPLPYTKLGTKGRNNEQEASESREIGTGQDSPRAQLLPRHSLSLNLDFSTDTPIRGRIFSRILPPFENEEHFLGGVHMSCDRRKVIGTMLHCFRDLLFYRLVRHCASLTPIRFQQRVKAKIQSIVDRPSGILKVGCSHLCFVRRNRSHASRIQKQENLI
jgi:hypothetical protein